MSNHAPTRWYDRRPLEVVLIHRFLHTFVTAGAVEGAVLAARPAAVVAAPAPPPRRVPTTLTPDHTATLVKQPAGGQVEQNSALLKGPHKLTI